MSVFEPTCPLTDRETELLKLARAGMSTREMAQMLFLSEGTVRNYLSETIAKLGAGSRTEAIRNAEAKGWL